MKLKPEERAEIKIGGWLMENGFEIYVNRNGKVKNLLECGTFSVRGKLRKIPDLVVYDGHDWFVIEIKPGIGSGATRDSRKIVDYYKNYLYGKTKYFIDEMEIIPKYFLVASFSSPQGHLFDKEYIVRERDVIDARIKGVPQQEYWKTFAFARQIWDEWKPHKNEQFAMGVLLSSILNRNGTIPAVFVQQHNKRLNKWLPPHNFYNIGRNYGKSS